jgi:HD-GYP domain-containing protein (c-di-GMP phosphodiesterase class II)
MRKLPKPARIYISSIILLGLAFLGYFSQKIVLPRWWELLFWTVLIILTKLLSIPLPKGGATMTVTSALYFSLIPLYGPIVTAWLAIPGDMALNGIIRKKPLYRIEFNALQLVISIGLAGLVYQHLGGQLMPTSYGQTILPFIALTITFFLVNTLLVSIAICLMERMSPLRIWWVNYSWTSVDLLALGPLGFLLALVYMQIGPWAVFICLAPIILARYSFKLYVDLRQSYLNSITALSAALDASDPYTHGHSNRVAENAEKVAREMGLSEGKIEKVKFAGQLHDIGKIGLDMEILNKPSSLSDRDWEEMKKHPAKGAEIVKGLKPPIYDIVMAHQEHYDGAGYPLKLKGDQIPVEARIIHTCDAFEAMTSDRPYRPALPLSKALEELKREAGKQFDPRVVEAFLKLIEKGKLIIEREKKRKFTEIKKGLSKELISHSEVSTSWPQEGHPLRK